MKFIELTDALQNQKILVNIAHIVAILATNSGESELWFAGDDSPMIVKEPVSKIRIMLIG